MFYVIFPQPTPCENHLHEFQLIEIFYEVRLITQNFLHHSLNATSKTIKCPSVNITKGTLGQTYVKRFATLKKHVVISNCVYAIRFKLRFCDIKLRFYKLLRHRFHVRFQLTFVSRHCSNQVGASCAELFNRTILTQISRK